MQLVDNKALLHTRSCLSLLSDATRFSSSWRCCFNSSDWPARASSSQVGGGAMIELADFKLLISVVRSVTANSNSEILSSYVRFISVFKLHAGLRTFIFILWVFLYNFKYNNLIINKIIIKDYGNNKQYLNIFISKHSYQIFIKKISKCSIH